MTFGGTAPGYAYVDDSGVIRFSTVAHPAGTVDVVVTNPGGLRDTVARGFTFESPAAFDFTGTWVAHAGPEYETEMKFTVEGNRLTSVTCGGTAPIGLASSLSIFNGEFSIPSSGGLAMFARMVSPNQAVGGITLGSCGESRWWAERTDPTGAFATVRQP